MSVGPRLAFSPLYTPFGVFNLIQLPVLLYAFFIIPLLFFYFPILGLQWLSGRYRKKSREEFEKRAPFFRPTNLSTFAKSLEARALKENWKAFFYIVMLGTPLVALLCVIYGHHPLSFSAYDSPFQAFAITYGVLWTIVTFGILAITVYPFVSAPLIADPSPLFSNIFLFVLGIVVVSYTVLFFVYLFYTYFYVLYRGTGKLVQKVIISIGIFTVLQPFIFRALRYELLPWLYPNMPPFGVYNAYYVIAFFVPCFAFTIVIMYLDQRYISKRKTSLGLHAGLLYLALLAATLH